MNTADNIYTDALDNAVASVEIEGYDVTDKQKALCLDFMLGKINKEDFIKTVLEGC